jgi:hypothetical protein
MFLAMLPSQKEILRRGGLATARIHAGVPCVIDDTKVNNRGWIRKYPNGSADAAGRSRQGIDGNL